MAAGKSTLAEALAKRHGAAIFSEDQLLEGLYPGEIIDLAGYVKFSSRVKTALEPVLINLLQTGTALVLDFPANTVEQRRWLTSLAAQAGVAHEMHYLQRSDQQCKRQLEKRARENPERRRTDTPEMFDAVTKHFRAPGENENLNLIVSCSE
jgi:predicted kinase